MGNGGHHRAPPINSSARRGMVRMKGKWADPARTSTKLSSSTNALRMLEKWVFAAYFIPTNAAKERLRGRNANGRLKPRGFEGCKIAG